VLLLTTTAHLLERGLDAHSNERFSWVRGREGERLVSWTLDALGRDWHVFHNVRLFERQDYDHILVGPRGIFYVQTKFLRGHFTRQGDTLLQNGRNFHEPELIRKQAWELKDRLAAETGSGVRWVKAVMVVPFAKVDVRGDVKNVTVVQEDGLIDCIEAQKEEFDRAQIDVFVEVLERIARARPMQRSTPSMSAAGRVYVNEELVTEADRRT
jgi:hypothetical protein